MIMEENGIVKYSEKYAMEYSFSWRHFWKWKKDINDIKEAKKLLDEMNSKHDKIRFRIIKIK